MKKIQKINLQTTDEILQNPRFRQVFRPDWDMSDDSRYEGLPSFFSLYPQFLNFFNLIQNHSRASNRVADWAENALLFYMSSSMTDAFLGPEILIRGKKHVRVDNVCWECCSGYVPSKNLLDESYKDSTRSVEVNPIFITINSKRMFVGYFIPTKKSLFLADLTHFPDSPASVTVIRLILNYFIKRKLITILYRNPKKKRTEVKVVERIVPSLGADPEFEGMINGRVVRGTNMPRFQSIDRSNLTNPRTKVGLDGAADPIELRPDPATTVEGAIKNMTDLFKSVTDMELTVAGNTYSIGGHIHIGGVKFDRMQDDPFVKLLDRLIGKPTFKMNGRARNGHYARLSETERKPYGFEYRSLPAAVFYCPEMLRLVYKIAQESANMWFNGDAISYGKNLKEDLQTIGKLTDEEVQSYFGLIAAYEPVEKNTVAAWVDGYKPKAPKKYPVTIVFSEKDVWSSSVVESLRNALSGLTSFINNKKIRFYGLSQGRGNVVAGLNPIPGYSTVGRMSGDEYAMQEINIGLPRDLRAKDSISDDVLNAIVEQVKQMA